MAEQIKMSAAQLEDLIVKDVRRHAHCGAFKSIHVYKIAEGQILGANWNCANGGTDYGGADKRICDEALREVVPRMQRQYRLI
jgi:hypothetical protein